MRAVDDLGALLAWAAAEAARHRAELAGQIHSVLGPGSVLNVGAGSGNYEPSDRSVVAVEPSLRMLAQRVSREAPVVRAVAEALPFGDRSFEVAMAVLTVHHWSNAAAGLGEMAREIRQVLVPRDCIDGFGLAFWARPEAYLDPDVQAGMSWLALLAEEERAEGPARLRADLESGQWDRRYGHLRELEVFDGGYRLAIAGAQ